jgi:hypothetical protein
VTDDIVTRLRNGRGGISLLGEAADEIERLRETMRLMYAHYHAGDGAEFVAVYERTVRGEQG